MTKVHGNIQTEDGKYDMDKDTFVRELSIQTGFSMADTRVFMDGMQKIFEKAILSGVPLSIRGLGHLTFSEIQGHRGFNARKYKEALKSNPSASKDDFYEDYGSAMRINFALSQNLRDLLRPEGKKKIKKA